MSDEKRDGLTISKEHVPFQSLLLQRHPTVQKSENNTLFENKRLQARFLVLEAKARRSTTS